MAGRHRLRMRSMALPVILIIPEWSGGLRHAILTNGQSSGCSAKFAHSKKKRKKWNRPKFPNKLLVNGGPPDIFVKEKYFVKMMHNFKYRRNKISNIPK